MNYRSAFLSPVALLAGSVLLAGCTGWSAQPPIKGNPIVGIWSHPEIDSAAPGQGSGDFANQSAHHYRGLADYFTRQGWYVDSDYFARKGLVAARNVVVPPEQNSNWSIPLEVPLHSRTIMARERVRLLAALDGGGRDRYPAIAARTQVAYDCWLAQTEMNFQTGWDGACHKDFVRDLAELERLLHLRAAVVPVPPAMHQFNVYFEFDRAELTGEGSQVVSAAARDAVAGHARVSLDGKADLTGTDGYNMALSHRRADTVRHQLNADGVPNNRIDEHWDGFRAPPVPTAPGVREPRNRVVQIQIQ